VVQIWVQVVNSDRIDAENLKNGRISEAGVFVAKGILSQIRVVRRRTTRLVGGANDLEAVARVGIDKVVALDLERLHSSSKGGAERDEAGLELNNGQGRQHVLQISLMALNPHVFDRQEAVGLSAGGRAGFDDAAGADQGRQASYCWTKRGRGPRPEGQIQGPMTTHCG